ncbi:MAG: hypothetical protein K2Y32_06595 [Candidatus Obscuribacterales bacterium]|nr:hypothetical protein [Candidatus Obscuribacterales bacterium]
MSPSFSSQNTVGNYFQQILRDWVVNGKFPETTVEACSPSLATKLGASTETFTFDNYIHSSQTPEWSLRPLDFGPDLGGTLYIYLPTTWAQLNKLDNATQVLSGGLPRQTLYLMDKPDWSKTLEQFLSQGEISAFVYYLIQPPEFHQWICCMESGNRVWVFGFYTAPGKLLITKADATDKASLELQLTSLINSNPWYGFISTASSTSLSPV